MVTVDSQIEQLIRINTAFKPSSPIDDYSLFAGRKNQLNMIVSAIMQTGLHVILYGERGVGKTSLVSILSAVFSQHKDRLRFVRVNCDTQQEFSPLWRRVLRELRFASPSTGLGFDQQKDTLQSAIEYLNEADPSPDDIRLIFQRLPIQPIIILDEIDRIEDSTVRRQLADTIKALSDHSSPATLVLVGVADSVDGLIGEHQSIERALAQVHLPRMYPAELHEALDKCLNEAQMTMTSEAKEYIVVMSKGLPHYTHLLGSLAAQEANQNNRSTIVIHDVEDALLKAVEDNTQTIASNYNHATHSNRKETMHKIVLLACALAEPEDRMGYFTAPKVRRELNELLGRRIKVSHFTRHLTDFSSEKRGDILQRSGKPRRYFYRFRNPLMQPFVIMKGIEQGIIDYDKIQRMQR